MCFSATGSFAVAAGLAGIGAVAVSRTKPPSHRLFAFVPLLFAIQQIAEGMVWLTMPSQDSRLHHAAVDIFLIFAVVVWPTWVPLCLVPIERQPRRKKPLRVLLALGTCVSLYAGWLLFQGQPVAKIESHSLAYDYSEPGNALVLALYLPPRGGTTRPRRTKGRDRGARERLSARGRRIGSRRASIDSKKLDAVRRS